ncbi:2889ec46-e7e6-4db9-bf8f-75ef9ce4748e [Sclerotinia trifoliorum]|uniref:2889ec46-e7e6-4db9-bf8f-75ef9ce4748e n=1 Tax=Sclerotinia trifoliorum TaxID=28548 RepID=A0A8H2W208_9HELO|nr:2889ec46-e7e6-4db9-bf8f-75ef9ce4748e [Sclerotinia trifoliorum]
MPYCESCNSKIAHQPSWKIEHSVFVSVGGKPATLAYCPTPAELHRAMWDPEYGRGGVCMRPNTAQTSPPGSAIEPTGPTATSSKYSTPTRSFMNNAKKELGHRVMSALSETRESLSSAASDQVELIEIGRYEKLPHDRVPTTFVAPQNIGGQGAIRKVSNIMNVNLPPGRDIPNANFARKNELIQVGQPTPDYLLALRQPTLDEVVDRLWESKIKCPDSNPLRSYLNNYYSLPASPSVFFDGGLDYKWDTPDIIESTENDISNIYSASGIDELLQSTHLTYEDSHNITDDYQIENTYHAHTTDCVEQFGLSKLSISNSHDTKLFEDKEGEILYPTVYVPPAKDRISKKSGRVEHSKKENRKGNSALKSERYQIECEHHDRDSCDGICQSWECRYKQEYRKSIGNVVKWSEPSSRYAGESEESEESRLSPTVYSPPSSLDPFNKYKGSPRSTKPSWGENSISPHFIVDCLETCGAETATSDKPTLPKEENLEVTMSLEEVNLTPPGRLSKRSYLPKIPVGSESPAAFGRRKAGSPKNSIPLTTEFPLSLKLQTDVNQYTTTNGDLTIPYFLKHSNDSPSPVIASNLVRKGIMDFDGAADVCFPKQNNRTKQSNSDNKPKTLHNSPDSHDGHSLYDENNLGEAAKRFLMELNQGRLPTLQSPTICPPQPLYICKQPSQVQLEQAAEHQNHNTSHEKARFPPRSSSIPKRECSGSIEQARPFLFDQEVTIREPKSQLDDPKISISRSTKISQIYSNQPNTPEIAARSTVSDIKQYYFSSSSSGLFGDFIPIGSPGSFYSPPPPQQQLPLQTMSANSSAYGHKTENSRNPYAFEPETPLIMDELRQTTMTDFMHIYDDVRPASSPSLGLGHVKNSRSVGHTTNRSDPLAAPQYSSHGQGLQRSGTSPSVTPSRFVAREESPNPKHQAYHADVDSISPILNNAYPTQSLPHRGRAATFEHSRTPLRKGSQERFPQPSRSPARKPSGDHRVQPSQTSDEAGPDGRGRSATYTPIRKEMNSNYSNESYSSSASTTINRHMTRSPAKNLIDVTEQDEPNFESPDMLLMFPKKRSRSPMKKMFGEHGWLGSSPNEVIPSVLSSKSATQKIDKPRKPGMMEKIKNKIEGFTEKADMKNDKNRISVLSISINPYEQARYLVELELMIVHTANTFLMIQFSQGRMSIDSIKKTVDTWKNKGRPAVVEFMYDQGTQRDLVTANQYNFRFHGNRLGDDVRISSMLYNWKQVASLMSIRTFCNADTVLLKLVFDVEQILELIGGSEQIMLRLQHLRLSINEAIRIAKVDRATRTSRNGHDKQWESHSSSGIAHNDPYGCMKLVPERYLG